MATKKRSKARSKPKKKKKPAARKPARRAKPAAGKAVKKKTKKTVGKKPKAKARPKKATARKVAPKKKTSAPRRPMPAAAPAPLTVPPPGGVRIGIVTHYYSHLSVAIIHMESGSLREGDFIHIKGHTTDFSQRVESMELDHVHVSEGRPGESLGVKVREHAREHDVVYKVPAL